MHLNLQQRLWLAIGIGAGLAIILSYVSAFIALQFRLDLTGVINGVIIGYAIKRYSRRPDHAVGLVAVVSTLVSVLLTTFAVIIITTGNISLYFSPNAWIFVLGDFIDLFSFHGIMSLLWLLIGMYISYRIVLE